ncbi:MAG TPA: cadherin-like domain-containing protein, partial [Pirellulales bacterium]|nr:cadherin-like domain-containing protein [Pirellulales bacterium]
ALTATVSYASQPSQDVVSVLQVTASPAAIEAGQPVGVSATIFDGVGNPRGALALYTVTDAKGKSVFTSTAVPLQLTAIADTESVDLGQMSTTALTAGTYTITVSVTEQDGTPIAGATGQGTLVVHSPVTASLSLDNNVQTPGNSTVTDTLTVTSNAQLGNVATDGSAESVAVLGNLAYVAGTQDIAIVDITDPASPQLVKTFGASDLAQGGYNLVQVSGSNLLVASQDTSGQTPSFNLLVYSLADPRNPTLTSTTTVGYEYVQSLFVQGSTALVATGGINYDENGNVTNQFGNLVSVDVSNPAAPSVAGSLFNSLGQPDGGASNQHSVVAVGNSLAYVLGSTSSGNTTVTGSGVVQVVNDSNPSGLSLVTTLDIPGTVHLLAVAIDGNQALVVGSSGGWTNPFADPTQIGLSGNVTLTLLDISDPANPKIVGSTVTTAAQLVAGQSTGSVSAVALGNGRYAIGDVQENGQSVILTVDASDPTNPAVGSINVAGDINSLAVSGDELLAASAGGLTVYRVAALFNQPVTVDVTVPTTGGVAVDPSTFSLTPTKITSGANSETLEWSLNLVAGGTDTITWSTDLTGLSADQVLPVVAGASVTDGGSTFSLPALNVAAEPTIQTVQIPVEVVAPGADAIANASFAATQLGNTALANRLNDLGTAVDNLVENVTSAIYKSQVQSGVTAVAGLLSADAFANPFAPTLTTDGAAVVAATTAKDVQAALTILGGDLSSLSQTLLDEADYGYTVRLVPNTATVLSGAPADFEIDLRNIGTQSASYTLNYFGPGQGVFKQNGQTITDVTLAPGEELFGGASGITLEVTESGPLTPADFRVQVGADQAATSLTSLVQGTLTVPASFVTVPTVTANPAFVPAGSASTLVDVTAKVLNAVNETEAALASYTVVDAGGKVVFTSKPVSLSLTIGTSLIPVDLGSFDTSKLAEGSYTIDVTVTDASGKAIPGATGQGGVLVGTPLTASLSLSATTLPPNSDNTITDTLAISGQVTLPDPLTLDGQVQTTPSGTSVALFSNGAQELAYVAGTNGIDIVDVTKPTAPVDKGTFGTSDIVQGGLTVCRVDSISGTNYLIVGSTTQNGNSVAPFNLLLYSLADPLSPTLVSNTQFSTSLNGTAYNYGFLSDMVAQGNTVLIPSSAFHFFGIVFDAQYGNVVAIDVSNPAAPALEGVLFPGTTNADSLTTQFGATIVNSQIAYVSSTTTTGGDTQNGVGRVLVVDYSDPTNMKVLREVDIPNTYQVVDVAVEGNRALVVSRTGGTDGAGINGSLTLSVLDITDPTNPQLLGTTLVTDVAFPTAGGVSKISALPIGNNQFAISEGTVNGKNVLLLADVTDPNNIVVTTDTVPALANEMAVNGNLLYTTSSAGLLIYTIGTIESLPFTASVEVPNSANLTVDAATFNIPPTTTVKGTDFTTYTWTQSLAFGEAAPTFTWQTRVFGGQPGQSLQVAGPGSVAFTSQGTSATLDLPPQYVASNQEITLSPASETVQPGAAAQYTLTIENPYPNDNTYSLYVQGVPAGWVNLPTTATVPANGSLAVPMTLTSDEFTPDGNYAFTVLTGDLSSVQGTLVLAGLPANPPDADSHGIVATLTPATASAGQGTSAAYTVELTNTGSADETYRLTDSLPAGVTGTFSQTTIDVPPGVSNFRDVTLTLTPQVGTTAGNDAFSVTATSTSTLHPAVTSTADGTLTVVAGGVSVALTPGSTTPGSPLDLKVTNTGKASDTFKLALAGPAALVSTLANSQVTLDAGASTTVPIATTAVDFADAGALTLTGTATSATNSSVQNEATADLSIAATQSMTASFTPTQQTLAQPGATSFLLEVKNTGNTEDSYSATIVSSSGPVTASLIGLDGQPAQSVPLFILPGLSTGAILLDVSGSATGSGTVKVLVQSLTTGSIQTTATATLTVSAMPGKLALAANLGLSLAEGSSSAIGQATLDTTDSDIAVLPADIVYTLSGGPANGSLTLGGQTLAAGGTFTQDDINSGRLAYKATAEGADSFAFSLAAGGAKGPSATFVVAVSDPAVVATGGFTYSAIEGSTAASQTVATFTDPGGAESPTNYSATIDWGDGNASAGAISLDSTTHAFTVSGQHSYGEEGSYAVDVTLHHASAPDATTTSTAVVSDPAVVATGGFTYSATEGSTAASQTVATFTDPGGAESLTNYSATIDWGDGNTSAGAISLDSTTHAFTVSGQHSYGEEG